MSVIILSAAAGAVGAGLFGLGYCLGRRAGRRHPKRAVTDSFLNLLTH